MVSGSLWKILNFFKVFVSVRRKNMLNQSSSVCFQFLHFTRHSKLKNRAVSEVLLGMMAREEGKNLLLCGGDRNPGILCAEWDNIPFTCSPTQLAEMTFFPYFFALPSLLLPHIIGSFVHGRKSSCYANHRMNWGQNPEGIYLYFVRWLYIAKWSTAGQDNSCQGNVLLLLSSKASERKCYFGSIWPDSFISWFL